MSAYALVRLSNKLRLLGDEVRSYAEYFIVFRDVINYVTIDTTMLYFIISTNVHYCNNNNRGSKISFMNVLLNLTLFEEI